MTADMERWEIGPFTFTAIERIGHFDDGTLDRIELEASWDDWPVVIGTYPTDVEVNQLKRDSVKWLTTKIGEWNNEAINLLLSLT